MSKYLILSFFTSCMAFLYAQKQINLIATNNISIDDQRKIDHIVSLINNDKKLKGSQVDFVCLLSEDESEINISINTESELISNYSNKIFVDKTTEIESIKKMTSNRVTYEFISNSNSIQLDFDISFNDMDVLFKKLRKEKADKLNIIFNNGFMPFLYSKENIVKTLNNAASKGELDKYKPQITNPNNYHRDLRPDATHYYINFTLHDLFQSFDVELYLKLINGDSVLLFKECINTIDISEFRLNKKNIDFAIYQENDQKYNLAIKESFIVDIFYKNGIPYLKSSDFPDIDDCDGCKYKTLYRQKFTLNIKGCAPNVPNKIIPTGYPNTNFFLFQCPNKEQ